MKIAVITDDANTISAHFGRARHFLVFTVEEGRIASRELRDKAGHDNFAGHNHEIDQDDHDHHDHHNHRHEGRDDPRGHGFGHGSGHRHAEMLAVIKDCNVLIARGMGQGAYIALQEADIMPITTEIKTIDEAISAYLDGSLADRPERRH